MSAQQVPPGGPVLPGPPAAPQNPPGNTPQNIAAYTILYNNDNKVRPVRPLTLDAGQVRKYGVSYKPRGDPCARCLHHILKDDPHELMRWDNRGHRYMSVVCETPIGGKFPEVVSLVAPN